MDLGREPCSVVVLERQSGDAPGFAHEFMKL